MDAVVDRFIVCRKHEKAIKAGIAATLLTGDGLMQRGSPSKAHTEARGRPLLQGLCSATHHLVYGGIEPEYFMFNNPESACRTCGGLGIHKITHPELLFPTRSAAFAAAVLLKKPIGTIPILGTAGSFIAFRSC